ncbi:MAG: hypothetical protein IMY73_01940 [Bacteroidetes bacterium]|nr:hypothetical protein [Bacteroidota bacterium]
MSKIIVNKENITEKYEMLYSLVRSVYYEVKELSKKKPDDALNKFKVETLNKILKPVKELMKDEIYFDFLQLLEVDSLPTNSDATIIIGQYFEMFEQFKMKYICH